MKQRLQEVSDELELGETVFLDESLNPVRSIIEQFHNDASRLLDILIGIQRTYQHIPHCIIPFVAEQLKISIADVRQTISFYHFFSELPRGKFTIYLNDSVVSFMMGMQEVQRAFEEETKCLFGNVTKDGLFGLFHTSCIGMSDQEPAALINGQVFTKLTSFRAREIIRDLKAGIPLDKIACEAYGDGNNSHPDLRSIVCNNIRKKGPLLAEDHRLGDALRKAVRFSPDQVIAEIKNSNLRGRGGAGFPTGMKWEICKGVKDPEKYVFCNADEGEPGTFKDRVLLTQYPKLLLEGMAIAGYAVGASQGIIYLRHEYSYLRNFLEKSIEEMQKKNLLGKKIAGLENFDFEIRIQMGAGSYVCGEESALLESAEGKRGEPRDRPPFPVEKGYLGKPTIVNNVETLCNVVKIVLHGAEWFTSFGTKDSAGTKILSICGDCFHPGIYELEWGFSISEVLDMAGAHDVQAVQIGGPSGALIGPNEFHRILSYADLSTGGSFIIFNRTRDLLKDVVMNFTRFFMEESCGSCSTCRTIPVHMKMTMEKILCGKGVNRDVQDLLEWSKFLRASRCGLGQTAANPIVSSIKNFRGLYDQRIQHGKDFESTFDLLTAVQESCDTVARVPQVH